MRKLLIVALFGILLTGPLMARAEDPPQANAIDVAKEMVAAAHMIDMMGTALDLVSQSMEGLIERANPVHCVDRNREEPGDDGVGYLGSDADSEPYHEQGIPTDQRHREQRRQQWSRCRTQEWAQPGDRSHADSERPCESKGDDDFRDGQAKRNHVVEP